MIQTVADLVYKYFFVRLLSFPENAAHPWDYYAHFVVSFALVGVLFGIIFGVFALFSSRLPDDIANGKVALIAAPISVLLIGAIKEWSDWRMGSRDITGDLLADALGVGLAILVALVVMNVMKMTS